LALKGVPGIYYHSLVGSRSWREGVRQTGRKRTINREKLDYQELIKNIHQDGTLRSMVFNGYLALLKVRGTRAVEAFDPAADQTILDLDNRLFVLIRQSLTGNQKVLCLTNVSREKITLVLEQNQFPGPWENLLSRGSKFSEGRTNLEIDLAPYGVLWLLHQ